MATPYYKTKNYQFQRSIGHLLRKAGKLITTQIEDVFTEQDIGFVQWAILMKLRTGAVKTAAEICQNMCHNSGAITRVLDQLEESGLIARERSTQDRRIVELTLTPAGHETTEVFLPLVIDLYNSLLEDFSKEEIDILIDLLIRLNAKLSDYAKPKAS